MTTVDGHGIGVVVQDEDPVGTGNTNRHELHKSQPWGEPRLARDRVDDEGEWNRQQKVEPIS
jgi:hypothetical protein